MVNQDVLQTQTFNFNLRVNGVGITPHFIRDTCFFVFVFEAHQWFTSCGEPSVFTSVKSCL